MKNILSQSAFWIINKAISKELGIDGALLLAEFIYKQENCRLEKDGSFEFFKDDIEEVTTISSYRQSQAITKLKEYNLITIQKKNIPSRFYYRINLKEVNSLVNKLHSK